MFGSRKHLVHSLVTQTNIMGPLHFRGQLGQLLSIDSNPTNQIIECCDIISHNLILLMRHLLLYVTTLWGRGIYYPWGNGGLERSSNSQGHSRGRWRAGSWMRPVDARSQAQAWCSALFQHTQPSGGYIWRSLKTDGTVISSVVQWLVTPQSIRDF